MIFLKFDRRIFHYFDWTLLAVVLCVCAMGILNIYSTGFSAAEGQIPFYLKQMQWIVLGLIFMTFIFFMDYRVIVQYAYIISGFCCRVFFTWRAKVDRRRFLRCSTF
jgi:rod shape determining protein RodA